MEGHYPFELPPLPYAYDALEPYIDAETMHLHHDRHLQAYVDNLNAALKDYPLYHSWSLEQLLRNLDLLPASIRTAVENNAGGIYNHVLYFNMMGKGNSRPSGAMLRAIEKTFGSYERFQQELKQAGLDRFGSGWAWLALNPAGELKILSTPNQGTLLQTGLRPVVLVDVWEHAYYLKYQNRRGDYIDNWFHVLDWEKAEALLAEQ